MRLMEILVRLLVCQLTASVAFMKPGLQLKCHLQKHYSHVVYRTVVEESELVFNAVM